MSAKYSNVPLQATVKPIPFHVSIPDNQLFEFRDLLKHSKLAAPTYENSQEDGRYGISLKWLTEAKDRWENHFDWRASEAIINSFPNFMMPVDTGHEKFDIHFVGLFSERADAIPVILLHGWPGSFLEFLPMLSLMKDRYSPKELPYHIVVPSLPGYVFSSTPPLDKDFTVQGAARLMNLLMINLGFEAGYVAQGGDIGSYICRILAVEHESCKATLLNLCSLREEPKTIGQSSINAKEREGMAQAQKFWGTGTAYAQEHGTRPSTIGLVLASNPLALLAWIGEKLLDWTDHKPSLDTILEAVTLYWLTDTFPRAIYPYRSNFSPANSGRPQDPAYYIRKPFGFSWFPKEPASVPRSWVESTGDLVFYRQHNEGGHFAALEQPKALMEDVEAFIKQVWTK